MTDNRALKYLAALLRSIDDAAADPRALDTLLDVLAGIDELFAGSALFRGYGGGSFVAASSRGLSSQEARRWRHWPLRRLFVRMKPCRILDPSGNDRQALAIPFVDDTRRWIALAPLRPSLDRSSVREVFEVLESVTVPADSVRLDSQIPLSPLEPIVVGFALPGELQSRLFDAVAARGWQLENIATFANLARRLHESVPDIIVVDLSRLSDPISAVTSIHRIANFSALRIVAFHAADFAKECAPAVIDRLLPDDASGELIFRAIKDVAFESSALRSNAAREEHVVAQRRAGNALTIAELVAFAAEKAATIMHGWAHCVLVNGAQVYRAEYPERSPKVIGSIPKTFLSGVRAFDSVFKVELLDELTDDPQEQAALSAMHPQSAATVALVSPDGRHQGVLVACSTERHVDSRSFSALDDLCDIVVARFAQLQRDYRFIPEFQKDRFWEHLRDRALTLDVYRSAGCVTPWRYRLFTDTDGLLTLNIDEDDAFVQRLVDRPLRTRHSLGEILGSRYDDQPFFAGTIDFAAQCMSFATQGFSPPMFLNRTGPVSAIRSAGRLAIGTAMLDASSKAVICDKGLLSWLDGRNAEIHTLRSALERERPQGLASIVTLG